MRPHAHRALLPALQPRRRWKYGSCRGSAKSWLQAARTHPRPQRQRQARQQHQQQHLQCVEVDPRRRRGDAGRAGFDAQVPASPPHRARRCPTARWPARAAWTASHSPCRQPERCSPSRRGSRAPDRAGTCRRSSPAPARPRPGAAPARCAHRSKAGSMWPSRQQKPSMRPRWHRQRTPGAACASAARRAPGPGAARPVRPIRRLPARAAPHRPPGSSRSPPTPVAPAG